MNKIILITGATSGFGKAIAEKFASCGWNCIITGRRSDRLHELANVLREKYGVRILSLVFDVRNQEEVKQNLENLPEEWHNVEVLVNNAGLALGRDPINTGNTEDWDIMIDTNIKGLLYTTRAIASYMIANQKGHIINMGSIAGKEVYENGNVYCATKFAVDALSRSMRIDLLKHKIKVTNINPGAAETEFSLVRFKGDAEKSESAYKGYTPLYANDVAEITWYCANLPAHVCINDLEVTCTAQANVVNFFKE